MKPSHAIIIRFHYQESDKRFEWRFCYFIAMVLPRILNQTDQDFDIWIRCYEWQRQLFESLSPKIKTFTVANEGARYKTVGGKQYFLDFVPWADVEGLPQYDIQTGLDSDDLIEPDFVARIQEEVAKASDSLHISFQPKLFNTNTLQTRSMVTQYSPTKGSAFMSLYQPDKSDYHFIYEISHLQLWKLAKSSITIPEGYCWATIHKINESTGV